MVQFVVESKRKNERRTFENYQSAVEYFNIKIAECGRAKLYRAITKVEVTVLLDR